MTRSDLSNKKAIYVLLIISNLALLMLPTNGFAIVKLPRLISDGMVLQRDQKLRIWGWADVNETVEIQFNKNVYKTTCGLAKVWYINIPPTQAGGPYQIIIQGKNRIVINDVLFGDVWLCSGQSNMQRSLADFSDRYKGEIENSKNYNIRQFFVNRNFAYQPLFDVTSDGWKIADSVSVKKFSAVAYFFGKALYEKYHIPIGLINSSYSGTDIEAWIGEQGLKEFPKPLKQLQIFQNAANVTLALNNNKKIIDDWNKQVLESDLGLQGNIHWSNPGFDATDWKPINVPGYWDDQGLGNINGVVWYRKEFDITAEQAGLNAKLILGNIEERDSTYLNGILIGFNDSRQSPRKYNVPAMLLKPGKNILTVRIVNTEGEGGFMENKPCQLVVGNGVIPLAGQWKYKVGASIAALKKSDIVEFNNIPGVLFNAMINPLSNYAIKGVLWYQGENNAGRNPYEYRDFLNALINNWRNDHDHINVPFVIVQLPNFKKQKPLPVESQWAILRESQLQALKLPKTGVAVTYDIGDANDIHPSNKMDVGLRAALVARQIAYGEQINSMGPMFKAMQVTDSKAILSFNNTGHGLLSRGEKELQGFSIAGADRNFVWAKAEIDGNKVIVFNDAIKYPIAVRYAWSDNPEGANLANSNGILAYPFRTDNWIAPLVK